MTEAVFTVEGVQVRTGPSAAGPWNPTMQHGGAPSSLIAWTAEQMPSPAPMRIARVTAELLRPVPVADLEIATEVIRQGRKIQLVQVRLSAKGVEVARGMVLKVRVEEMNLPDGVGGPPLDLDHPDSITPEPKVGRGGNAFGEIFTMRRLRGGFGRGGPAAVWFRLNTPMVAGFENSPAIRAVAAAGFSNGISAVLPFKDWTFVNGDLTVSFARLPRGEWIASNAESWIGPDGAGLAMTRLADLDGYFGRAVQSLVVERR